MPRPAEASAFYSLLIETPVNFKEAERTDRLSQLLKNFRPRQEAQPLAISARKFCRDQVTEAMGIADLKENVSNSKDEKFLPYT